MCLRSLKLCLCMRKGIQIYAQITDLYLLFPYSKIFEKLIYSRLYFYLEKFNLLNRHQSGFRRDTSTIHSTCNTYDKLIKNIDKNLYACYVFLDLTKAYHSFKNQIKSSLHSPFYAEASNELRGPSPRLSAWATQLRRNVAMVASRWRHCVNLNGPGIEPQTSRTDSVRFTTELTAGYHSISLEKMDSGFGIHGLSLKLFPSYLTNRYQYTKINNKSQLNKVICGVPQGSSLGPLLFFVYINDLPLVSSFDTTLFANNTYLMLAGESPAKLLCRVNSELNKMIPGCEEISYL